MRTVKRGFNRFLLHLFIKDEGMFPMCGTAFSIYLPFHSAPAARIEVTAHLESSACEIVNFYVCRELAHKGCGKILLERVEQYMALNGIKMITVVPISMVSEQLPKLTNEKLIHIYKHLGFMEQENKGYMSKVIMIPGCSEGIFTAPFSISKIPVQALS